MLLVANFFIQTYVLPKNYQSDIQVVLSSTKEENESYDGLRYTIQMVSTYSSIIQSSKVEKQALAKVNLTSLNDYKVTVETAENSLILLMRVTGKRPENVQKIVQSLQKESAIELKKVFPNTQVTMLEEATQPKTDSRLLNYILVFILSELLAVFVIVILSTSNPKLDNASVLDGTGIFILGQLPMLTKKERKKIQ